MFALGFAGVLVLAVFGYIIANMGIAAGGLQTMNGKLSIAQIAALASGAGFTGDDLTTAVAIALAESNGNPSAYNPETAAGAAQGAGSYGLWQIYLTAHPEYTADELIDPVQNASAAFAIYRATGYSFHPWSTFKNGAYLSYVSGVKASEGTIS